MANKLVQLKDGSDNVYPTELTVNGTVTVESGIYVNGETQVFRKGDLVIVHLCFTGISTTLNASGKVATISGVPFPKKNVRSVSGIGSQLWELRNIAYTLLNTDGEVYVNRVNSTDTAIAMEFIYSAS